VKRILIAAVAALLLATMGGCTAPTGSGDTLVVGTEAAYAPFEFVDETTGDYKGFDIDLVQAIGKEMGVTVQIRNIAWDGLIPALSNGEVDAIISAMTITDKRAETVTFSDPYFTAGQVICCQEGGQVTGPADLVDKAVGVQANTTGHYAVQAIEGMKDSDIKKFETTPDAMQALMNGSVDFVVADIPVVLEFIKNNPNANIVTSGGAFTVEYYGIAMRKDDTELHSRINKALAKVKAGGKYDEIYQKWFGKE